MPQVQEPRTRTDSTTSDGSVRAGGPSSTTTARLTGAQAIVRCLELEGVPVVFGHPGGAVLPLYDAIYQSKQLKHVLVRHEQCAAHMAEGYARASGKVGVCIATSGPGATNLVTGIADAFLDSIPLVAITGNVARAMIGTDAFQEADITGITMPITKHNWLVAEPDELPQILQEAFHVARSGRPGPVLVDVPKDVQNTELDFTWSPRVDFLGYPRSKGGPPLRFTDAAALVRGARCPVVYLGGGVHAADAYEQVRELVELIGAPVVTTVHGKGAFPETHRLCLGMFGMHGARFANFAVQNADLLIAIGARFDDRVTGRLSAFAPRAKVIHIDIDPAELGKNVPATVALAGSVADVVPGLTAAVRLAFADHGRADYAAWLHQVDDWRDKHPLRIRQPADGAILPQTVVDLLYRKTEGRAIVTTGVGEHQMFAAQHYKTNFPRQFISSGGLGTMGFCLPAAIGAKLARPDALVIGIDGDGSFQMTLQEMATAKKLELPIKIFILNNLYLGMVRQWQELFYENRYSEVLLGDCPDFVTLADAYGWLGLRVSALDELEPIVDLALAHTHGPVLVDVRVKEDECCYPMVAPGAALDEMMGDE